MGRHLDGHVDGGDAGGVAQARGHEARETAGARRDVEPEDEEAGREHERVHVVVRCGGQRKARRTCEVRDDERLHERAAVRLL